MRMLAWPALVCMANSAVAADPYWLEPMKAVRSRFTGVQGTFAQFGDSITVSMAFWAPLAQISAERSSDAGATLGMSALETVRGHLLAECWRGWKGPEFGSNGSMTIRWAHENVLGWLDRLKPETAHIMFGTNDLTELELAEYERLTAEVVDRCLERGTIVILSTIPPRSGLLEKSRAFAEVVRRVARQKQVPLIDYFDEVLKRRPDDWDGSRPAFKDPAGDEYQVPTLISRDGVHPSNPKEHNRLTEEALRCNGYLLRNYLTLETYAAVVKSILAPRRVEEDAALRQALSLYASFDKEVRADVAGGERTLSTRSNHETQKDVHVFTPGFDPKALRIGKGIHAGALECDAVLPRNGRVFFPARGNIVYQQGGWAGTLSVWINTDPELLLRTPFCDPVQITHKGAGNGGLWCDFNDQKPRQMRFGAFPALASGEKGIPEFDPNAPMVRAGSPGFKAGEWHHLAMVWKGFDTGKPDAELQCYVDGKLAGTLKDRAIAMGWDLDRAGIYIAVNYVGSLDELAVFSRALSSADVARLHRRPGCLAAKP